jgi:16S rRNA (adenine1518-N6/adenine1519-N6)-dimethyltransferase
MDIEKLRMRKKLGQNMLTNPRIAQLEASYGKGKRVVEIGPGLGILTGELCKTAKSVVAVEKDRRFFEVLENKLKNDKLKLINSDFFDLDYKDLDKPEIMISNIPYNLSSRVIFWLQQHGLTAVLCLQREFVEHMLAAPGSRSYSKLSVVSHLQFDIESIMDVKAANFYPVPKVDSEIVKIMPKGVEIDERTLFVLNLVMEHKKKKVRNAIVDSSSGLKISKGEARQLAEFVSGAERRVFQMEPKEILHLSNEIVENLGN